MKYSIRRVAALSRQSECPAGAARSGFAFLADLQPGVNQLRCLVDIFHLTGIAVVFDIVYNHAGGDFGDESLYFFDRQTFGTNNSLYFTDQGWAGGLVFAYWNAGVRQFLIDNAKVSIQGIPYRWFSL